MDDPVSVQKRDESAGVLQASVPPLTTRAVTPRALGTALLIIVAGVLWDEWAAYYLRGSRLTRSHFPMAVFFPFLSVTVLSMLINRFRPGRGLTRPELLVVLGMGLVAMTIPFDGLTGGLIGILGGSTYLASPENGWALYIHDHIPAWLVPHDRGNAIVWFYEGVPPRGEFPALGAWVTPLFWWTTLVGGLAFSLFCLVVMLRKQWSEHERLTYPLMEVGQMLTETEAGGRMPALFRSPLFWSGFGLVMGLKMWNVVSYFSPLFPAVPFEGARLILMPDFPHLIRRVSFYAVGFGYFARLDVLFSVWFFLLATGFEVFAFNRLGYALGASEDQWSSVALSWQSLGALIFLAGWSLWMARVHLGNVWRKALHPGCEVDDSRELISYRLAVLGLAGSLLFVGGWLHAAGMEPTVVLTFLPVSLLIYLGLSRVVAELGLVYVYHTVYPYRAMIQAWGTQTLGHSSVTTLSFMHVFHSLGRGFVTPAFTQAVKAVEWVASPRKIAFALWLALAVALAVSISDTLALGYYYGGYNMKGQMLWAPRTTFNYTVSAIRNPAPPGGEGRVAWAAIGAVAMALLTLVRYRAPWWPLHPIGLAIQGGWGVTKSGMSVFLVWAVKSIIVRIGGAGLYERGKPFFVGILAGQALSTAVIFVIDMIWFPIKGHNVHNY